MVSLGLGPSAGLEKDGVGDGEGDGRETWREMLTPWVTLAHGHVTPISAQPSRGLFCGSLDTFSPSFSPVIAFNQGPTFLTSAKTIFQIRWTCLLGGTPVLDTESTLCQWRRGSHAAWRGCWSQRGLSTEVPQAWTPVPRGRYG